MLLQIRGIPNGRHTVEARIVGVIRGQRNSLEKVVIFFEDPYCKFPRSFDAFFFCANYRKKVETWPLGSAWSLVLPVAGMVGPGRIRSTTRIPSYFHNHLRMGSATYEGLFVNT